MGKDRLAPLICLTLQLSVYLCELQPWSQANAFAHDESSVSLYDDLRSSQTATFEPLVTGTPRSDGKLVTHLGRNLHRVNEEENGMEEDLILCHIPIFSPWSDVASITSSRVDMMTDDSAYSGSAAALMAIHHFNNGDGSVAQELEGINKTCNIRFTTELIDTGSSAMLAVDELTRLVTRDVRAIERPQPCAILGSFSPTVTRKMATVTGVYDMLQLSPMASSVTLDDSIEYPLFGRTRPSDSAAAELGVSYLAEVLNVRYFALLYVSNGFGTSFKKDVLLAAARRHINVETVAIIPGSSNATIEGAIQHLKNTNRNYIMAALSQDNFEQIMERAGKIGVAGPEQFWLFTDTLASSFVDGRKILPSDSLAAEAIGGAGIISCHGGLPGVPQFDRFVDSWRRFGSNSESLDYVNSKQPLPPRGSNFSYSKTTDYFLETPVHSATFSYDAVVGMGLSACEAAAKTNDKNVFTGSEHHNEFVKTSFKGASGYVEIGPNSFSRNATSTFFVVSNIRGREFNGQSEFEGVPVRYYDTEERKWSLYQSNRFIYADGSVFPPKELPELYEEKNYLEHGIRGVCLSLAFIAMSFSVGLIVLTIVHRKHSVILASQPAFLVMICIGTLIMSSTIIPASLDDSIVSQRGCDIACNSNSWLFSIGFVTTFSALFSKLWRVNKLFRNGHGYRRAKVTPKDVIVPFFVLLFCNASILLIWTFESPQYWRREAIAVDSYGRVTKSIGSCTSDHWTIYLVALVAIEISAVILALWQAFHARNITTEFSESKYIAMAMICIFQVLFIGIPMLYLVSENSAALLFVESGIIFIISMAILVLIFFPKIDVIRKGLPENYIESGPKWLDSSSGSGGGGGGRRRRSSSLGRLSYLTSMEIARQQRGIVSKRPNGQDFGV